MMKIKDKILKFVNKPVNNILSSQTLYEALFANINMYLKYKDEKYQNRCKQIAKLISDTQLDDGGFDIGYNFCFGNNMTKKLEKESTTPEVLSIFALLKYYEVFKDEEVIASIQKGIKWIKEKTYRNEQGLYVIPYAPCSYKQVHITNAISFTVATLGYYAYLFQDHQYDEICRDMLKYMKNELLIQDDKGYWNYFEKILMNEKSYVKVDNYHIGQQLYYHILLSQYFENEDNEEIIKFVSNYIINKLKDNIAVPYIEIEDKATTDIHSWGYCSLLLCTLKLNHKELAEEVVNYMMKYMIIDNHFSPVIKNTGEIIEKEYYPRSDAWVLHALSEYLLLQKENVEVIEVVNKGLEKLEEKNYRGLENHVYTFRKKVFSGIARMIKKIIK